ncbi:MAG: carbohydrate ABC transporter permease [Chloroflexi bacterium]|nr:carbohydrate ABC transporter permease [Chloroflexota bacterium]
MITRRNDHTSAPEVARRRVISWERLFLAIAAHLVVGAFVVISLMPFIWMLSTALKEGPEILVVPPDLIPKRLAWENFAAVMEKAPFLRFYLNSLIQGIAATFSTVLIAAMMGYAFAKYRFRGRDLLFLMVLSSLMLPEIVRIIPVYLMITDWGWQDSYTALIVPELVTGFAVFLMRQFILGVPDELLDAARIDGASELRIWGQIVLPLCTPALAALTIFRFNHNWDNFLWPLVVIQRPDMRTVPLGLAILQGDYQTVAYHHAMAATLIAILPVVIVFLLLQRQFIRGIALTGLREG